MLNRKRLVERSIKKQVQPSILYDILHYPYSLLATWGINTMASRS